MAKNKIPLTPEEAEVKAIKKAKSSQNWTKFWAIVLALAITGGVVFAGKKVASKDAPAVEQEQTQDAGADAQADEDEEDDPFADDEEPAEDNKEEAEKPAEKPADKEEAEKPADKEEAEKPADKEDAKPSDDKTSNGGSSSANKGDGNADNSVDVKSALTKLNNATKDAAKCNNYSWDRTCDGSLSIPSVEKIDKIAAAVLKGMTVTTVVENFLGFGEFKGDIDRAKIKENHDENAPKHEKGAYFYDRYMFTATNLTEDDVTKFKADGNTYTFKLKDCENPKMDGNNALRHATTDFVTHEEVAQNLEWSVKGLIKLTESDVKYSNIYLVAKISDDGKLESMNLKYKMTVSKLELNVAKGNSGQGKVDVTYSNFH